MFQTEISPSSGVYLPTGIYNHIEMTAKKNWEVMVRETLLIIYGKNIAYYSATGKRTSKPPIDRRILVGLYGN